MSLPDDPFIFVSYSSKDAAFVHAEIERLEKQGYRVWYDQGELQLARLWAKEIREAITACSCFIVFITEDSVASDHVCIEIDQALRENKPLICIYWDNVKLPDNLQTSVRQIQTLDRYAMHQSAYEGPLSKALSEYIHPALTALPDRKPGIVPPPNPPAPDSLPTIVFFALVVAAALSWLIAVLFNIAPPFISRSPDELNSNFQVGLFTGGVFVVFGLGLIGAAISVFRKYLRSKK